MQPFLCEKGIAAPFLAENIDTDVIMPKQFLKGIDRKGLADGVFFDERFLENGLQNPDFILNNPFWKNSCFLVTGHNFGCGSSREHAVWGLQQLGIRALIGTTFAGIFYDNCQRNGVLTITLDEDSHNVLAKKISNANTNEITVDLVNQKINIKGDISIHFEISPLRKDALIKGIDAIGLTLKSSPGIRSFEVNYFKEFPWLDMR